MGNIIVGVPVESRHGAGVRPLCDRWRRADPSANRWGTLFKFSTGNDQFSWDVGAGLMGYFNEHIGLRGDIRYFRAFRGDVVHGLDLSGMNFWRASVGVVFR